MRILGALLLIVGLLLCFTVIGLPLGIILVLFGIVFMALGGRRKVVINNVVHVENTNGRGYSEPDRAPGRKKNFAENSVVDARPEPLLEPPMKRLPEPAPFDLVYEEEPFTDVRSDITTESKRVLAFAKAGGFEIVARPDRIIVRRDGQELVFQRNSEILDFGAENGLG